MPPAAATTRRSQRKNEEATSPSAAAVSASEGSDDGSNNTVKTELGTPEEEEERGGDAEPATAATRESEYANIMRVKKEEVDQIYSDQAAPNNPERMARQQAMRAALTVPNTQDTPRALFRRGCHKLCITTVLGGSGTSPCPLVNRVPDGGNAFIQPGERYIAGQCDWNPWAPRFPGDNGLVDADFVSHEQEEYHMFTSVSNDSDSPLYHGKKKKGAYLYLGKYSIPEQGAEDDIVQGLRYEDLAPGLQWFRAEYYNRKGCALAWTDPITNEQRQASADDITPEHYSRAQQEHCDEAVADAQGKWDDVSDADRAAVSGSWAACKKRALDDAKKTFHQQDATVAAWVVMLRAKNYVINLVPVKFQRYDEALYEKLVAIGAASGHVNLGANSV